MFQKLFKYLVQMVALMVMGCSDSNTAPENRPIIPEGVSFSLVSAPTDTVLRIKVNWSKAEDAYGPADFYRHTMTASKIVTDSLTGPLPTLKEVNGLADTVSIKVSLVNDTVTLISKVWSVRRGLQSSNPAQGNLFVRRGDRPPPPPDSIKVDTIVIPIAPVIGGLSQVLTKVESNTNVKSITPFRREENGTTLYKMGNTTILTLVK